ncbi:MAG: hypothetical protein HC889_09380 [Synechococcaceae cyanobacterium SM1_2_3]|nr:hypothetical protein [Synechococcaceae cyanobacterium SM1_2_3]
MIVDSRASGCAGFGGVPAGWEPLVSDVATVGLVVFFCGMAGLRCGSIAGWVRGEGEGGGCGGASSR